MKISEAWLREWADPGIPVGELSDQLTMAGLEVDAVSAYGPSLDKVVVGEVMKVAAHPNADIAE